MARECDDRRYSTSRALLRVHQTLVQSLPIHSAFVYGFPSAGYSCDRVNDIGWRYRQLEPVADIDAEFLGDRRGQSDLNNRTLARSRA